MSENSTNSQPSDGAAPLAKDIKQLAYLVAAAAVVDVIQLAIYAFTTSDNLSLLAEISMLSDVVTAVALVAILVGIITGNKRIMSQCRHLKIVSIALIMVGTLLMLF